MAKMTTRTGQLLGAAVAGAVALSLAGTGAMGQPAGGRGGAILQRALPAVAPAPPQNGGGGQLAGDDSENPMQVYIEDSFAAGEKLTRAMNFERKGQIPEAIEAYQGIIDDYGDKLAKLNTDTYVSIMEIVRQRLAAMPAVKAGAYDDKYSVAAEAAIKAAVATRDLSALIKACDRYYIASAAVKGLQTAAEWEFERGEFTMAARLWGQLADHPRAGALAPEYLHHAGLAAHMEGSETLAKKLRDRLESSAANATGIVNGKTVNLVDNLDELCKMPAWETAAIAPGEWPTFLGNAARSGVPDVSSTAGAKLWSYTLDDGKNASAVSTIYSGNGRVVMGGRARYVNGQPDLGPGLSSFGVMSDGMLYVHGGDHIVALSAASGGVRWNYPTTADTPAAMSARQQAQLRNLQMYGINSLSSGSQDSCTVFGDQIFAILPASPQPNQPYAGTIQNSKLVALDKAGQELFKPVLASDLEIAKQGGVAFVGSPLATAHGVFVLARRMGTDTFTNLYLCRINRTTGAVDWTRYLCGAAAGQISGNLMAQFQAAAAPAFADDTVYITTGQGVDAAVDGPTGRVRWLTLTSLARQPRGTSVYDGSVQMGVPAWKFNAPIVVGEKLVSLEPQSAFRVYDRWTGKAVVEVPTKDLQNPEILAGVIGDNAVLVGSNIHIVSLSTGKLMVDPDDVPLPNQGDTGKMMGRPFLTKQFLYMPMEKALVMVDLEGGKRTNFAAWPKDEKGVQAKPGNVLVTSEQVIVINDGEVASYAKWETARDTRLAEIKAKPNEPEGYLSLAEVAFRTQHFDVAQENMAKAVDLAIAKGMQSVIIGQIYHTNLTLAQQLVARGEEFWPGARFYFAQARKSAGNPEANAEWRMALSGLAVSEKKSAEAAELYNQVLTDAGMRSATLHRGDSSEQAGTMAESAFKALMERSPEVYKPFEDQAAAALAKVRTGQDLAAYQNVIDSYPNSKAALTAGAQLAILQEKNGNFESQIHTLNWMKGKTGGSSERARILADLAIADAKLKRWDSARKMIELGKRLEPNLKWTTAGRAMSFEILTADLPQNESRPPSLLTPMDETVVKLAGGKAVGLAQTGAGDARLLVPMETNPAARRPEVIPVLEGGHKVRLYEAKGLGERWNAELPDAGETVLLGYSANAMLLLQRNQLIGLDLKTGALTYKITFETDNANDPNRHQNEAAQLQNAVMNQLQQNPQTQINWQMNQQNGDGEFQLNPPNQGNQMTIDADQVHVMQYRQLLGGNPTFNAIRIFGSRIAVITGNRLDAYDSTTGKHAWDTVQLPSGCAQSITGNDELIVAEVERIDTNNPMAPGTGTAQFVVIDDGGKRRATLSLDEHVMWRHLGDDGMLTCVTEEGASAFDLAGDGTRPKWHRDDVHAMAPTAIAMGLDGVSMVSRNRASGTAELVCLEPDKGVSAFTPKGVDIGAANPMTGIQYLKLIADGDTVIVQSTSSVTAYKTGGPDAGNIAWAGIFSEPPPPLVASQMTEKQIALLGYGPMPNADRAVKIVLFNRVDPKTGQLTNGKNELEKPLRRSSEKNDLTGPVIQRWAVVDGAICLDINGSVVVYRSAVQAAALP